MNNKEIVTIMLSYILNDEVLSLPVFVENIRREDDCNDLGIFPLLCVWRNIERDSTYTHTVNGGCVAYLLESIITREHKEFEEIRDEILFHLAKIGSETLSSMCKKLGVFQNKYFKILK